ncbi:cupin domain-containing protein [Proteiniclasticum sediminis]|uniref:cupin domain-containing protein n=1 Tax=Proteiniclasticum sediminis TaxID=2804028 RepID=UPI001E38ED87|nr:cupin domain-containing protein [Proteiniclasticum sediminis]
MLLRHREDMKTYLMENMRGGQGTVEVVHLLNPEEMLGKGRLFAENIVPPGASIGLHPHSGDIEAYYFLEGSGMYQNNEEFYPVKAGDLTVVDDQNQHGITNTGDIPLRFIALILYTGEGK